MSAESERPIGNSDGALHTFIIDRGPDQFAGFGVEGFIKWIGKAPYIPNEFFLLGHHSVRALVARIPELVNGGLSPIGVS
jgi:hypothetical protein